MARIVCVFREGRLGAGGRGILARGLTSTQSIPSALGRINADFIFGGLNYSVKSSSIKNHGVSDSHAFLWSRCGNDWEVLGS